MKMTKKIISCMLSLVMLVSMFSLITVNATDNLDGITLSCSFSNEENGNGDGSITISNIDSALQSAITNVNIYWGASAAERLEPYYNIASYTVAEAPAFDEIKLEYNENGELVYNLTRGSLIPNGATHIIADVITSDNNKKQISVAIPEKKQLNAPKEDMLYSMVWASDIHTTRESAFENSQVDKMMKDIVTLSEMSGEKFKGAVFNGDITDQSIDYQWEIVEDYMDKYQIDFPIYYNTGNHDTAVKVTVQKDLTDGAKVAFDKRFEKLKNQFGITFDHSDPWNYETYINGQHHIFLSLPYATTYALSEKSKKWLEEKLSYDEKSGIPTFVYAHMPYEQSGFSSIDASSSFDEGFGDIIKRHPSSIVVTSHVHFEPAKEATINYNIADGIPYIDTACVKFQSDGARGGNMIYMEVYPNRVIVKTRNVRDNKWVPHGEHIVPVANYGKTIAEKFAITGNDNNMSEGTVLTATLNGVAVDTAVYDVTWNDMTGAALGTGATYKVATPNESVSAKIVRKADNAYAYAVARYIAPKSEDDDDDGDDGNDIQLPTISTGTTVKYSDDIVYLSGNAGAANAGQEATLVLTEKAEYPNLSNAKYFGHCIVGQDGGYQFKFKASDMSAEDMLLVKVGNGEPLAYEVREKGADDSVELVPSLTAENKVSLSMINKYADEGYSKIIVATFNGDGDERQLQDVKIYDYTLIFNENGDPQEWISDDVITSGENIELFMWKAGSLVPLSGKKQLN